MKNNPNVPQKRFGMPMWQIKIFAHYKYKDMQMSDVISGVIEPKFTKFLYDVAKSSPLLLHAFSIHGDISNR